MNNFDKFTLQYILYKIWIIMILFDGIFLSIIWHNLSHNNPNLTRTQITIILANKYTIAWYGLYILATIPFIHMILVSIIPYIKEKIQRRKND